MKTLSDFLLRIANWKSLVLFIALYMVFPAYILKNAETKINELAGKEVGIIDLSFGFNQQKTLSMVTDYGDAGRQYYAQTEMTTDVIYPVVYAFLFGILLTLLFRNTNFIWVNVIPFITMIFDFGENVNIVYLLKTYPAQSVPFATLCELFKMLKWLSFGIIILFIIYGLMMKVWKKNKTIASHSN